MILAVSLSYLLGVSVVCAYLEIVDDGSYRYIIMYVLIAIASFIGRVVSNG